MKTKILIPAALLFLVSACGKDNQETRKKVTTLQNSSRTIINLSEPGNSKNPLDSFGALHNLGILSYKEHLAKTGDTSFEKASRYLYDYYKKDGHVPGPKEMLTTLPAYLKDIKNNYKKRLATARLSPSARKLSMELFDTLAAITSLDYVSIKQKILAIEEKIPAISMPSPEKEILLKACAVARHSAYLWFNQPAQMMTRGKIWNTVKQIFGVVNVVMADVWATYVGVTFLPLTRETIYFIGICSVGTALFFGLY